MPSQASSSPRVARRRREQASRIVRAAARRFAEQGPDQVRIEWIADDADVARGTLYSHFPTKQSLLEAVIRPALEQELKAIRQLRRRPPLGALRGLLESYLDLWQLHGDALRVAHGPGRWTPSASVHPLHEELFGEVGALLARVHRSGILRGDDPGLATEVMARLAVPLLELCDGRPLGAALFVDLMQALLLKCDPPARPRPGGRARRSPRGGRRV